jgi:hypothetical protein
MIFGWFCISCRQPATNSAPADNTKDVVFLNEAKDLLLEQTGASAPAFDTVTGVGA